MSTIITTPQDIEAQRHTGRENIANLLQTGGSILPAPIRRVLPDEFYKHQRRALRFAQKLGYYAGVSPFPRVYSSSSWIASWDRHSFIAEPVAAKVAARMKADERAALALARQAKSAPIPQERALVLWTEPTPVVPNAPCSRSAFVRVPPPSRDEYARRMAARRIGGGETQCDPVADIAKLPPPLSEPGIKPDAAEWLCDFLEV